MSGTTGAGLVVRKAVRVRLAPDAAFRLFTEGLGRWWPLATHSVFGDEAVTAILEPRVGGRFYERKRDGTESDWGQVLEWDPPRLVAFTMHPGHDAGRAGRVDVSFAAAGDGGTEVVLEHRGWEIHGTDAERYFRAYQTGWDPVLASFAAAAG